MGARFSGFVCWDAACGAGLGWACEGCGGVEREPWRGHGVCGERGGARGSAGGKGLGVMRNEAAYWVDGAVCGAAVRA